MRPRSLALGDAAAISTFAVIGVRSHGRAITPVAVARNAVPVLIGWFAASTVTGAYRRPSLRSAIATWAVGVPMGVAVRQVLLRRPLSRETVQFGSIVMGTTLALLLGWRAAAGRLGAASW